MLEYINPTIKIILTFFGRLLEIGELEEYHPYILGEDLVRPCVHERHIRAELRTDVIQTEIQEGDEIHGVNAVLPVHSALALPGDGFRGVVDAPLLEEGLFAVLHLHDDVLVVRCAAKDVIDERTVVGELHFGAKIQRIPLMNNKNQRFLHERGAKSCCSPVKAQNGRIRTE